MFHFTFTLFGRTFDVWLTWPLTIERAEDMEWNEQDNARLANLVNAALAMRAHLWMSSPMVTSEQVISDAFRAAYLWQPPLGPRGYIATDRYLDPDELNDLRAAAVAVGAGGLMPSLRA